MQPKTWKNPCIKLLNNEFHILLPRAPGLHIISAGREKHHSAEGWDTCKSSCRYDGETAPWCRDLHEPFLDQAPLVAQNSSDNEVGFAFVQLHSTAEGRQIPLELAQGIALTAPSPAQEQHHEPRAQPRDGSSWTRSPMSITRDYRRQSSSSVLPLSWTGTEPLQGQLSHQSCPAQGHPQDRFQIIHIKTSPISSRPVVIILEENPVRGTP